MGVAKAANALTCQVPTCSPLRLWARLRGGWDWHLPPVLLPHRAAGAGGLPGHPMISVHGRTGGILRSFEGEGVFAKWTAWPAEPETVVGYLTGEVLTGWHVDHVVARQEAWCSGIRDPAFSNDLANQRRANGSVNSGKGGRDPLEWWNTDGKTTPKTVTYPGWCDYLRLHVEIKVKWGGTMDLEEHEFIVGQLRGC